MNKKSKYWPKVKRNQMDQVTIKQAIKRLKAKIKLKRMMMMILKEVRLLQ
jgi:hypothetical protein